MPPPIPEPDLGRLASPRTRRRRARLERRLATRRNSSSPPVPPLVLMARTIASRSFQVAVSLRESYGDCFYVVCYDPVSCHEYNMPVPFSMLPRLLPDFALARASPKTVSD